MIIEKCMAHWLGLFFLLGGKIQKTTSSDKAFMLQSSIRSKNVLNQK